MNVCIFCTDLTNTDPALALKIKNECLHILY